MSSAANVPEDGSVLSRADRLLFRVEKALNLAAGVTIFALMLLAVAQILGRKLFNAPVTGFIDLVEIAMAAFAFLGAAYCQRLGGHVRMDILIGRMRGRALWAMELFGVLLMLALTLLLTIGSWLHFKRAYDFGDSSIDIALPLWPAKLLVPVALALLALRLLVQAWGYARAFWFGLERPAAVPLIQSAVETANREAAVLPGADADAGAGSGSDSGAGRGAA
ncbi:MAG: TRAP transporter small permease subunit [Rhodospirillales bacterium]